MTKLAVRFGAFAVASVLLVSGCGPVVSGTAMRDPRNTDNVTRAALQPGNYPTKPRQPLGAAGAAGNLVEARRMGEALVLPFQIDPELTKSGGLGNGVIKDAASVRKAFPEPLQLGADHNFIAGFTVVADNQGEQQKSIQTALLRFATPEDAVVAADDMLSRTGAMTSSFDDKPVAARPIGVPRYPDAKAVTWDSGYQGSALALAFTVRGPFVLGQVTISRAGADAAAGMIAATLDQQIPALDGFSPTPVDKLAELPLDRDDLLARTIPPPPEQNLVYHGIYGPHGILAFSNDPPRDAKLFVDVGVTTVAFSGVSTYLARDAKGAEEIVKQFAKTMQSRDYQPAAGVPGLPEAKCLTYNPEPSSYAVSRTYCVGSADRIAFEVTAGQQTAAHQQMAAQYLMLTEK